MRNDGGPAFPLTQDAIQYATKDFAMQGMSLRDYFAGEALKGVVSAMHGCGDYEAMTIAAYKYADAMLKEREK